jgi:putative phosphoribosyl transferase
MSGGIAAASGGRVVHAGRMGRLAWWGTHDPLRFADRRHAGEALAHAVVDELARLGLADKPVVLALARGGVPVGEAVARALDSALDVMVVRKVGLPRHPEYGVGAVTAAGLVYLDAGVLPRFGLTPEDLATVVDRERVEAAERLRRYRGDRPVPAVAGRTVVLVDDGVAAGVTARAAIRELRAGHAETIVLATPVGAPDSLDSLDADIVVCLSTPRQLGSVGRWYDDFRQVDDAEVIAALSPEH